MSVLQQTYPYFEHIIVDDGSTDGTAKAIRSFRDERIKFLQQENSGQSAARNKAINLARGKYIAFLDADDIWFPEKLERQVAFMEENPDVDFGYCKIYHFQSEKPDTLYLMKMEHPSGYLFSQLLVSNFINPLSVMVKKEVFDKYGAFEPKFPSADEQYLWLKLSYRGVKFGYLDIALGKCRLHATSFTQRPSYYQTSQEQCLQIFGLMRQWMTKEEIEKYNLAMLEKKNRRNISIGKLIAARNPFGRLMHFVYLLNRRRRLHRVKLSDNV